VKQVPEHYHQLLTKYGICSTCEHPIAFDPSEPFGYCDCGTTEWGRNRPVYRVVHEDEMIAERLLDHIDWGLSTNDFYANRNTDTGEYTVRVGNVFGVGRSFREAMMRLDEKVSKNANG